MTSQEIISASLLEGQRELATFIEQNTNDPVFARMAELVAETMRKGGKVMIAGNGGSMADAMHFAEEMTGRFRGDRRPLPAISIADPTHMSCVCNDYGYEAIFSRYIEALGKPGDVFIALSTSGNSKNLLVAAEVAKKMGIPVLSLLGKTGGPLKELSDIALIVPGKTSDRIQEIHMMLLHILVETTEAALDVYGESEPS